ncbi:hypothetical protein [Pseudoduganella lutea]|uniref:Uncharacterized protein n=1 Tax=Pseudoduganella lutea TaxID=321985 RepID=A0A4P6L3H9_9BURK|nr:hypothetical protein [Pseudoduganella lutea]QBE65997.1 hypothetical protein EWM63_25910 [Pseudoduganella lutea]
MLKEDGMYIFRNAILFGAFLMPTALAHAADASFPRKSRATITKATDVIMSPPTNIAVRSTLQFKQLNTSAARALASGGFQIRVFTLSHQAAIPGIVTELDDCNIYISAVIPVRAAADGMINLGEINEAWLGQSDSGDTVRSGRFLFIFEEFGPRDSLFRLRKEDAGSYFKQGFILTVDKSVRMSIEEARKKFTEAEENRVRLYIDANRIRDSVPCYRYMERKVAVQELPDMGVGDLFACTLKPNDALPSA